MLFLPVKTLIAREDEVILQVRRFHTPDRAPDRGRGDPQVHATLVRGHDPRPGKGAPPEGQRSARSCAWPADRRCRPKAGVSVPPLGGFMAFRHAAVRYELGAKGGSLAVAMLGVAWRCWGATEGARKSKANAAALAQDPGPAARQSGATFAAARAPGATRPQAAGSRRPLGPPRWAAPSNTYSSPRASPVSARPGLRYGATLARSARGRGPSPRGPIATSGLPATRWRASRKKRAAEHHLAWRLARWRSASPSGCRTPLRIRSCLGGKRG